MYTRPFCDFCLYVNRKISFLHIRLQCKCTNIIGIEKGKAILEIEVYLKKEMYYDMQTSKFKLKSMKHRVHVSFL